MCSTAAPATTGSSAAQGPISSTAAPAATSSTRATRNGSRSTAGPATTARAPTRATGSASSRRGSDRTAWGRALARLRAHPAFDELGEHVEVGKRVADRGAERQTVGDDPEKPGDL